MKNVMLAGRSLSVTLLLVLMIAGAALSAFAADPGSPVSRISYPGETHKGLCCKTWDAKVTINEPERPVPIIVTFSTGYRATGPFYVGMRLNGGPCVFNGPGYIPTYNPAEFSYASETFQWVIMPGDYLLAKGSNVIKVCGGAVFSGDDTIELGANTLTAVRLRN
jgi:hypothetical protein